MKLESVLMSGVAAALYGDNEGDRISYGIAFNTPIAKAPAAKAPAKKR